MTEISGVMIPRSTLYAMIHSQPAVISAALEVSEGLARQAAMILNKTSRVFLTGTGTNSHAAVVGEHLFRSAGIDAYATTNFDFATYPRELRAGDALVVLSHTGSTQFGTRVLSFASAAGVPTIGITGLGSSMPQVDCRLEVAPKERSDTYTQSYTATLAVLALIAAESGDVNGRDMTPLRRALRRVADDVAAILRREAALWPEAVALSQRRRVVLIGAGPNAVTAREGALKIKESSYLTAEGVELETMIHGGLQAVEEGDLAIVIAADGPALDRTTDVIMALHTIGASVLVLGDERIIDRVAMGDRIRVFPFASVPEPLSALLAAVPLQLLAAFTAFLSGTNPDNFRFDDEPHRKAIEGLTL